MGAVRPLRRRDLRRSGVLRINGECVCRECLEEFAGHWFAPFRLIGGGGAMSKKGRRSGDGARSLGAGGEGSQMELAARFGVNRQTV